VSGYCKPSPVPWRANRLSDEQKQDLVRRYQRGEGSQAWLRPSVCSASTVTPLVQGGSGEEVYGSSKRQNGQGPSFSPLATQRQCCCRR